MVEVDETQLMMMEYEVERIVQERIAELEFAREDIGWERINEGATKVEFSFNYLRRIVARSRLFFLSNPLIHRAVSLQSDYVFAQGMNIQATSPTVNDLIQEFIDDPGNQNELTGHEAMLLKEQTLMLDGNVFFLLFTNKQTGKVNVRSVLVDEITDIITNPDDMNEIWFYKREWDAQIFDNGNRTTEHKIAYYPDINYKPALDGRPKSLGNNTIYWDVPILHVKVGALSKSRYGVPETYSALDWAKAHQNFLEDWATIVKAYARFAFKATVTGNKGSVVAAKNKLSSTVGNDTVISSDLNPSPSVASVFIRKKDGDDIEPIKTSGATTNAQDGREIRMMVAAALGIPDTFFGDVDVGNLATARTLDRPTELKFSSRQKVWTNVITKIITYVIEESVKAPQGMLNKVARAVVDPSGRLTIVPGRDPKSKKKTDFHVEVVFPPILEHSIMDRINAVTEAVTLNGKQFAIDSPELTKLTLRLMFQALGLKDVDELLDLIVNDIVNKTSTPNNNQSQQLDMQGGTN